MLNRVNGLNGLRGRIQRGEGIVRRANPCVCDAEKPRPSFSLYKILDASFGDTSEAGGAHLGCGCQCDATARRIRGSSLEIGGEERSVEEGKRRGGHSAASSRKQVPNRARFGGSHKQLGSRNRPLGALISLPPLLQTLRSSIPLASALLQAFQIVYITYCM